MLEQIPKSYYIITSGSRFNFEQLKAPPNKTCQTHQESNKDCLVDILICVNPDLDSNLFDQLWLYKTLGKQFPTVLILTFERIALEVDFFQFDEIFGAVEIYDNPTLYAPEELKTEILKVLKSVPGRRVLIFRFNMNFNLDLTQLISKSNVNPSGDLIRVETFSNLVNLDEPYPDVVIDLGYTYDYQTTPLGSIKPYYRRLTELEANIRSLLAQDGVCYRFQPNFCFTYQEKIPKSLNLRLLFLLSQSDLSLTELGKILADVSTASLSKNINSLLKLGVIETGEKYRLTATGHWLQWLNDHLNFQLSVKLALTLKYWVGENFDVLPLIIIFAFLECYQTGYFDYKNEISSNTKFSNKNF